MSFAYSPPPIFKKSVHSDHIPPSSNNKSKKRKRRRSVSGDVKNHEFEPCKNSGPGESHGCLTTAPTLSAQVSVYQYEARHQDIIQPSDLEIYGKNFPHAKLGKDFENPIQDEQGGIQDILVVSRPRLFLKSRSEKNVIFVGGTTSSSRFRQQHLTAMTTLLHKCLSQGNYRRAGRAWGILHRTEVDGRSMDVRTHDQWGIGAELLCQQPSKSKRDLLVQKQDSLNDDSNKGDNDAESRSWFSREGFDEARDYYERLILQHPYRKAFPNAVDALDFYPAMFGLWIYSEQQQFELSLNTLRASDTRNNQSCGREDNSDHRNLSSSPSSQSHNQLADLSNIFMQRGQQVASRLKELVASPPFSDDARLWRLQGMVTKWIESFSISALP